MGRGRRRGLDRPSGILVIDKASGPTSSDVVQRVRRVLGVRKAGHTGTLDPLASGVLPICLNEATKIAGLLLADDKAYLATAELGWRTDTYDRLGREVERCGAEGIAEEAVAAALERFSGDIEQRPPAYSALHIGGRRAHELARAGKDVVLALRSVTVHRLRIERWDPPRVTLLVHCSKGTYVRSLVEDLGRVLGCGATLCELRRTRSGRFGLDDAIPLECLEGTDVASLPGLVSIDRALEHLPAADLGDAEQLRELTQGKAIPRFGSTSSPDRSDADPVRIRFGGEVIAIGALRRGMLHPRRVLVAVAEDMLARAALTSGRA